MMWRVENDTWHSTVVCCEHIRRSVPTEKKNGWRRKTEIILCRPIEWAIVNVVIFDAQKLNKWREPRRSRKMNDFLWKMAFDSFASWFWVLRAPLFTNVNIYYTSFFFFACDLWSLNSKSSRSNQGADVIAVFRGGNLSGNWSSQCRKWWSNRFNINSRNERGASPDTTTRK